MYCVMYYVIVVSSRYCELPSEDGYLLTETCKGTHIYKYTLKSHWTEYLKLILTVENEIKQWRKEKCLTKK
jgi:hypothetical protein